ncbi:MAG: hypothetical protein ACI9BD_000258 [Candidatus Marinamargulisbacteria bacterium]|jgi:hypothetical protein
MFSVSGSPFSFPSPSRPVEGLTDQQIRKPDQEASSLPFLRSPVIAIIKASMSSDIATEAVSLPEKSGSVAVCETGSRSGDDGSSAARSFLAGAFAGFAEVSTTYWTDVVKTREQNGQSFASRHLLGKTRELVAKEGGRVLVRGIVPPILNIMPYTAVMFGTYDGIKSYLTDGDIKNATVAQSAMAGFISGFPEALIANPAEVVKVRMQAKHSVDKTSVAAFRRIIAQEGFLGVYKGLLPLTLRGNIGNMAFFTTIDSSKRVLSQRTNNWYAQNMVPGCLAGVVTMTLNNPLDVINTRMKATGSEVGLMATAKKIVAQEGVSALWSGLGARCRRAGPGGAIMTGAYFWMMNR